MVAVLIFVAGRSAIASSLIEAASEGDMEKVQALLVKGADVNGKNYNDRTALMCAIPTGNFFKYWEMRINDQLDRPFINFVKEKFGNENL